MKLFYFHPITNPTPQQKSVTCFATLLQSELKSDVGNFCTQENKPILHQLRSLKAAKRFPRNLREVLLFAAKSVYVARFTVYGLDGINLPRLPLSAPL